ncbi:MAG: DNA polymerase III subunit delta [Oscillospiraceae bacterium]|nr:DNA polymerase III subunit delta [Oscillospiraceae bacterium]
MTEEMLNKEIKQKSLRQIYYIYGKEGFLVEMYAKRIRDICLSDDDDGLSSVNFTKFTGNPDISAFAEFIETVPLFAERRVVMLNDLDVEKLDAGSLDDLMKVLSTVDDCACVIIYLTGIQPDLKKAKTKKLIACIEKSVGKKKAGIINFEKMTEAKTADLVIKRAARNGCSVSRNNAELLSRLCLRNLTLVAVETDKLCAFADYKGEITKKSIETLTARQLDSGVFALATEITSKRGANAMLLLDELMEQGNPPVVIMSALSTTFIDFYRAKIGDSSGRRAEQIAKDFNYPPNRTWAVGKAIAAATRITATKLRACVGILCDTDYKLKSSPIDDRIIMERAIARLLTLC